MFLFLLFMLETTRIIYLVSLKTKLFLEFQVYSRALFQNSGVPYIFKREYVKGSPLKPNPL